MRRSTSSQFRLILDGLDHARWYRGIAIKNPPLTPDLARFSIWPGWFLFRLPDSQIWTKVVLISSAEILGHLIPKNARFCRFCTVKRSKSAQIFLARFARQFFCLIIRIFADFALQNTKKVLKFFWRASRAIFFRKVVLISSARSSNLSGWFLFHLSNSQIELGWFLLRGGSW